MNKIILHRKNSKEKILLGLNSLADPVRQTLTTRGGNVIIEDDGGVVRITNDGVTIANNIQLEDPIANAIIQIVRQAAMKTNAVAGDGTTTSILLAQVLIEEGFKLLERGWNPMALKRTLNNFGKIIVKHIKSQVKKIKNEKDLRFIANVSANNDEEIANNVVKAVLAVGEEGFCVIEDSPLAETRVEIEEGFEMGAGMLSPLFANQKNRLEAHYKNVKVLITDKRIYYSNEALAILEPLAQMGINDVVIVAKDFIGQAPNVFLANHLQKKMNILLVKDPTPDKNNNDLLEDLAAYLGVRIISDKAGKLTFNVGLDDFGEAKRVLSYSNRTMFYNFGDKNISLKMRVQSLKNEIDKLKTETEKEPLKKRLARMTRGTATISVGGKTPVEVREKMYRYEDSFNATRSGARDGYIVGGGLALYNALKHAQNDLQEAFKPEVVYLAENICLAPLKQISENCNLRFKTILSKVGKSNGKIGYNAVTEKYENLEEAGIIEPLLVLQCAFENALSVASMILSSSYLIVNKPDIYEGISSKKEKRTGRRSA